MKKVRLLGVLGQKFGREYQLDVSTPAEGLRALILQIPGLRQFLMESAENGIAYRVVTYDPGGLDEDELCLPFSKVFTVAPVPVGAGGVGKIVAGIALVAVSILFAPAGLLASSFFTLGSAVVAPIGGLGVALLFSGVADLLTPTPKVPNVTSGGSTSPAGGIQKSTSVAENQSSFTFDKNNANSQQGDCVPILYGERIIASLSILSFGLELKNEI